MILLPRIARASENTPRSAVYTLPWTIRTSASSTLDCADAFAQKAARTTSASAALFRLLQSDIVQFAGVLDGAASRGRAVGLKQESHEIHHILLRKATGVIG